MAETMSISEFKATCLAVLERVRRTGQRIIITRRGEAVAEVGPAPPAERPANWLGGFARRGKVTGDLVVPATQASDWEVLGE